MATTDLEALLQSGPAVGEAPPVDEVVRRASEAGLLDVAYAGVDAPIGRLTVAATPAGLVRVAFGHEDDVLTELAEEISPRVLEAPSRLDEVRRELDEYFAGRRNRFDVVVDWQLSHGFRRQVLQR
ncbi:MAG: methylated-DNA--[protein]-cysteine S-methyltransferase, partial [Acidimicrobiales bacterium]